MKNCLPTGLPVKPKTGSCASQFLFITFRNVSHRRLARFSLFSQNARVCMISGTVTFPLVASDPEHKIDDGQEHLLTAMAADTAQAEANLAQALNNLDQETSEQLSEQLHVVGEMLSALAERHIRR